MSKINIDRKNIQRGKRSEFSKQVNINIKITSKLHKWLKDNNYSPTRLFEESCTGLGYTPYSEKEETMPNKP